MDAPETGRLDREAALGTLAGADAAMLAELVAGLDVPAGWRVVRGPETGLVMVRGRAGGSGAPFNLGEVTVSRASVQLASGEVGHGYCLGRDHDKARRIAILDALGQRSADQLATVLARLRAARSASDARQRQETAATKVDFFTLVRGDD